MTQPTPTELFPDDQPDPTTGGAENPIGMPVERTLEIMGHIGVTTRRRNLNGWRYVRGTLSMDADGARKLFGAKSDAVVEHDGTTYAVWVGAEPPDFPAFEKEEPIPTPAPTVSAPAPALPPAQAKIIEINDGNKPKLPVSPAAFHDLAVRAYELSIRADGPIASRMLELSNEIHQLGYGLEIERVRANVRARMK